jgi:hypothetical protein
MSKFNFAFKVASDLQSTCSRSLGLQQSQGRLDLFIQGFTSHPLGPVAYVPSRALQPTVAPISIAPCLMALLPIDNLCGSVYSASLRPWCLPRRFRPLHLRLTTPRCVTTQVAVATQVVVGTHVVCYDLPKVGVAPQQRRDLDHAIAVSGAPVTVIGIDERLSIIHTQ